MSIARAFTTKRAKRDAPDALQRSLTGKHSSSTVSIRDKISSPVELISTTNMLSYNAPDLHPALSPSSSSNSDSASDSDHKSISSVSTPPSSPAPEKEVAEPNHLSCYFNAQPTAAKSTPNLQDPTAPLIPNRAPSHTKRSHENLVHKRSTSKASSLSHKSSAPAIGLENKTSISTIRTSLQIFESLHLQTLSLNNNRLPPHIPSISDPVIVQTIQPSRTPDSHPPSPGRVAKPRQGLPTRPNQKTPPMHSRSLSNSRPLKPQQQPKPDIILEKRSYAPHPFGNELAQVTELAEEYSGGNVGFGDEESALMSEKGLCRFSAEDYMGEIQGLAGGAYGENRQRTGVTGALWI